MHMDDMADACVYLIENFDADKIEEFVNIGVGKDISKPDGTPKKLLDVTKVF
jgi:GDP-L-fucose synthase